MIPGAPVIYFQGFSFRAQVLEFGFKVWVVTLTHFLVGFRCFVIAAEDLGPHIFAAFRNDRTP